MRTQKIEIVLVLLALVLFSWGLLRAVKRGDPVARRWPTPVMSGLIVFAASNVILRSRKVATAVLVVSGLLLFLALAAAGLSQAHGHSHPLPVVIRAISFLMLLGLTGWLQMHSARPPTHADQQCAPANGELRARKARQAVSPPIDMNNIPACTQVFADIREYWGYPPRQDKVLEEIFSGDQVGGDWDYAVHIHEGAEQYLGSEQFYGLEKRFASVPGVDECKHEDREVFLFRTRTLNVETLRESCWKQFMEAAKIAFDKEGTR